jgi:flagella basal body P-ring formation protein FlgA
MSNSKHILLVTFTCLLATLYTNAASAEADSNIQNLQGQQLKSYITDYALNHLAHQDDQTIEVNVMQLDPNIKLRPCATAIDISLSSQGHSEQSSAITLNCKETQPWTLYIPLNIQRFINVLVANRLMKAGDVITADDITFEKQDINHLTDGFFKDEQAIVGLAVLHSLNSGTVFNRRNTKAIPVIKKNQTLSLAIKTDGVEILMQGIAKSDGYLNQPIKVLNPSSKKIIDAIVKDNNKAEINY